MSASQTTTGGRPAPETRVTRAPAQSGRSGPPELAGQAVLDCCQQMHVDLRELLTVADTKLDALRSADTTTLARCARDEARLLERVFNGEKRRTAAVAQLAQSLHDPRGVGAPLTELVARAPEPLGSRLRAKTAGLRHTAAALKKKNDLNARVAHDLQCHIRAIFAELGKAQQETVGYGRGGKQEAAFKPRMMLDATG